MNKNLNLTFLFIFLLFLQVLVLNNVLLFGYVNPYVYISFIFLFPFKKNKIPLLSLAFLLGLFVDFFSNSGGIHASATLFIAFIRLYFFNIVFQKNEADYDFFSLEEETFGKKFNFTVILTIIHHFLLFSLTNFSFSNFSNVLLNTLLSSIFTLTLYFLGSFIFRQKK